MTIDQLIDMGLGVLLTAMLLYGMILSRRLAKFKSARGELEALVATLSGTVVQARNAVAELKTAGDEAEERLTIRLKQVRRLADEMNTMHASGEALAERLERAATRHAVRHAPVKPVEPAPIAVRPAPTSLAAQIAALQAARRAA